MKNNLFNNRTSYDEKESRMLAIKNEIVNMQAETFLSTPETDIINFIIDKYLPDIPEILKDNIYTEEPYECDIKGYSFGEIYTVKGSAINVHFPFKGDVYFFGVRPSTFEMTLYDADILEKYEIINTFKYPVKEFADIKNKIIDYMAPLERYLSYLKRDYSNFENNIRAESKSMITERKNRLLEQKKISDSLPFPIKKRSGEPTYNINVRKKIIPELTTVKKPYEPEPALSTKYYDDILKCLLRMSLVMEQSPSAFINMCEESLRFFFLVQLNSEFEVDAGGETFNLEGKTDILLRSKGYNVFIAELKFWGGAKLFSETIDQLLGYVRWRDTKTAILIFNKNKNFSDVLAQIPKIVVAHSNCKQQEKYEVSTGFRFLMKNKNDDKKEFLLTILCFDMPQK